MTIEDLGRGLGLIRMAIGLSALVAPSLPAIPWVGRGEARSPSVQLFARALGGRDLALGLGALTANEEGGALRNWITLGALADAGDALATVLAFKKLPRGPRWLILVLTVGAALVGSITGLAISRGPVPSS